MMFNSCTKLMMHGTGFRECLVALIVSIERVITARMRGETNTREVIFSAVVNGTGPDTCFTVSGVAGIILLTEYIRLGLQLSRLFHFPRTKKGKNSLSVKKLQEKTSNVVLVFYKKWAIIQQPAHAFTPKRLRLCMYACILLHNMIIEDEGRAICEYDENASYGNTVPVDPTQQDLNSFALTYDYMHANLQQDLVEHIWNNANDGDGDEDENE
ncbi:putative harbinger transposase-derived protein [Helianthus annuus]|nr:putative harbinger transposase-derived protein [Helianthus annuus]KAJ0880234.1 putative harbinger transposase-derived protein [Helianthus annuus]